MGRWTEQTVVGASPEAILASLTEPDEISRWAPIEFELIGHRRARLRVGDRVWVEGRLAGQTLRFEVDVAEAADGRLRLSATGPIRLDVDYRMQPLGEGSLLCASIEVSGRGIVGRMLARATDALLASGALALAVARIADRVERRPVPALAAA
jgi:hypothetical protein